MTYNPHLEDCSICGREFEEGDRVFAFFEDYVCSSCVTKDNGVSSLSTSVCVAFKSYPKARIEERVKKASHHNG